MEGMVGHDGAWVCLRVASAGACCPGTWPLLPTGVSRVDNGSVLGPSALGFGRSLGVGSCPSEHCSPTHHDVSAHRETFLELIQGQASLSFALITTPSFLQGGKRPSWKPANVFFPPVPLPSSSLSTFLLLLHPKCWDWLLGSSMSSPKRLASSSPRAPGRPTVWA